MENKINLFVENLIRITADAKGGFLDENNILWKVIGDKWIGKRSVWTYNFRACWLENTTIDNVKSWWCGGKDADYSEIFKRNET